MNRNRAIARRALGGCAIVVLSSAGWAADAPRIGPAPAFVKRVALPGGGASSDSQPAHIVLMDQQFRLEKGQTTSFSEIAIKVQSSQGLAVGNIALPWRPEQDELTVNTIAIHRGDKVIDVLGGGKGFTVIRRETDLEMATLDGVLTATMQVPDLQVGDTLDMAITTVSHDPTWQDHAEAIGANWNGAPIDRAHVRLSWPASLAVKARSFGGLAAATPVREGDTMVLEMASDKVVPQVLPTGAPARFRRGRGLEATSFAGWSALSALMAPLYEKASQITPGSALDREVDKIRAASSDPARRTEAALALVEEQVRYVALEMGAGGLVPAAAEASWQRRYGDCKGKTVLLLGILHKLGILANAVLVSSGGGDGLDERLPRIGLFDHVIVRATVGGKEVWLDGTRTGDGAIERLEVPDYKWGLPIAARGAALVALQPPPLSKPNVETAVAIDASTGLFAPAPTHIITVLRGDNALGFKSGLEAVAADLRDNALKAYWKNEYDFVEPAAVKAQFDPATGDERVTLDGTSKLEWKDGWFYVAGGSLAYKADFHRDEGPDREAPFTLGAPSFSKVVTSIKLPPMVARGAGNKISNIDETLAGMTYHRAVVVSDGSVVIEKSERSIAREISFKDAVAAQARLRALNDEDVYLQVPNNYVVSDADFAAMKASEPADKEGYFRRGLAMIDRGEYAEAVRDMTRAHELDPKDAWTLGNRAIAHAWLGHKAEAQADVAAARAITAEVAFLGNVPAILAMKEGKPLEAITALGATLAKQPDNRWALRNRAEQAAAAGKWDVVDADVASMVKASAGAPETYLWAANIYRRAGNMAKTVAQADALLAAKPADDNALMFAGAIYAGAQRRDKAMAAFDRALAIKPNAFIFVNRARARPVSDEAGKLADIDAALKLDPAVDGARLMRAGIERRQGNYPAAIADLDALLASSKGDPGLLTERGVVYAKAGKAVLAQQDFAAAAASVDGSDPTGQAVKLNNLCWTKATAGVALDSALANCDLALKALPGTAGFLDSRGLVLLRLGRIDEAIAAYSQALTTAPTMSSSLYGRGLAFKRKHDEAKAAADMAKAVEADADVAERSASFGL